MKLLMILFAMCLGPVLAAQVQAISFENTWKKGSNTVYAGVVNELIILGNTQDITGIRSSAGTLSRKGDTLIVKNNQLGSFTIELIKGDEVDSIELKTELLPPPGVSLTAEEVEQTEISKKKVLENGTLNIFARLRNTESIFDQYDLIQYELTIGNTTFKVVNQAEFTDEVKNAIESLSAGKNISVNYLCLFNKDTGKKVRLEIHKVFRIN